MMPVPLHPLGRLLQRETILKLGQRGVAAIELAFALPVYLALLFGIMDMGWLFYKQVTLDRATLMAARCGAVRQASCLNANDIKTYARVQSADINTDASSFTITNPSCGVKVESNLAHDFLFANGSLGSITLRSSACMARTDISP
ncbi:MAG: hypothetical protein RLZZ561_725 [Pseudomonadota bacterium]|jgi:Flp pilus assembly protein TadG